MKDTALTQQDLQDILDGACILASGGGGPYGLGTQLLRALVELGPPRVVAADAVPDGATMAVSACAGSPTASAGPGPFPYQVATTAFTALETLGGRAFEYVLPGELGAGNSFIPLLVAAQKKLPLVDASGAARAMSTLDMATYASAGVPPSPVVVADEDTEISFTAATAKKADPVMRAVISSGTFPNFAGVAFWSMDGATMKRSAMHGTLSTARTLGAAVREAKAGSRDPVAAVIDATRGKVLFRGKIIRTNEQQTGGFDVGVVTLQSPDGKAHCTVYNQNENLIAWTDQRPTPLGMGPDSLCWLTAEGQPFTNATPDIEAYARDAEIVLIGIPAARQYRTAHIIAAYLDLLRPMGYGGDYLPIEDLVG